MDCCKDEKEKKHESHKEHGPHDCCGDENKHGHSGHEMKSMGSHSHSTHQH